MGLGKEEERERDSANASDRPNGQTNTRPNGIQSNTHTQSHSHIVTKSRT